MPRTLAKFCSINKQHFASAFAYAGFVEKTPVREILAQNLKALMEKREDLGTQKQLGKKAGIAQTSVSNMLRPNSQSMKSPKLDQVEKVAGAFGLAVWQVLLDPKTVGKEMADMLMRPAVQDEDERLKSWDASRKMRPPFPPEAASSVQSTPRAPKPSLGSRRRLRARS